METRLEFVLELPGLDLAIAAIKAGVVAGLEAEGQATVADMKTRVPVKTGALRDSLGYRVDPDEPSLSLEATQDYAAYVEFGTRHMAAQPYFTPALDQMTVRLPETMARTINEALR